MKKREINIEFIRVFAIFMTVMIHVSNTYINNISKIDSFEFNTAVVYNSLSRVCVPLFFMVSGIFLIKQEYDRQKYINRIIKIIHRVGCFLKGTDVSYATFRFVALVILIN
jgi:surface polysaccharide O-acyltransferase-like enzyme